MTLHLYGASDDLIETEGDVSEEWNVYPDTNNHAYIRVTTADDEHINLEAWYGDLPNDDGLSGDGGWRWTIASVPVDLADFVHHHDARGEDEPKDSYGCPGHSERIHIDLEVAAVRVQHGETDRTERA